jgi:hypothetical protein
VSGGWSVAALEAEDGEFMVRSRARLPDPVDRARYPVAMWLTWSWGPIASEAEEDAIIDEMIRFETAVHEAAEAGGWGMLVAVVTNGAGREWLFHAADATEFVGEMRGALEGHPIYPFEVKAWKDPTWKAARELNTRSAMH